MQNISIGRDQDNQIVLNDKFVSRRHAQLSVLNTGNVVITDLNSSNGTFVNGVRITEKGLNLGDVVMCGSVLCDWEHYVRKGVNKYNEIIFSSNDNSHQDTKVSNISLNQNQEAIERVKINSPGKGRSNLPPSGIQQNVVIIGKAKSVGTAFILTFFFGPLGLFYISIIGGIVMFIVAVVLFVVIPVVGYFFVWLACIIWAVIGANQANDTLQKQAGAIISNNF